MTRTATMPAKRSNRTQRSARAPAHRALVVSAGLALVALTGCVDILGDFRESPPSTGCAGAACEPPPTWAYVYGDADDQAPAGVAVDRDDNILVASAVAGAIDFGKGVLTSAGSYDVVVAKIDPEGKTVFSQRLGGTDLDVVSSVAVDPDGNVLVAGFFTGTFMFGSESHTSAGDFDIFVLKLAPDGTLLWAETFGDAVGQAAFGVASDSKGNVIVTGCATGSVDFGGGARTSAGDADAFVAKLNSKGEHIWSLMVGDVGAECGARVATDAGDNILVSGTYTAAFDLGDSLTCNGAHDIFIARLDPADGHVLYGHGYGGAGDEQVGGLIAAPNGRILLAGSFAQEVDFGKGLVPAFDLSDPFIVMLESDGTTPGKRSLRSPRTANLRRDDRLRGQRCRLRGDHRQREGYERQQHLYCEVHL